MTTSQRLIFNRLSLTHCHIVNTLYASCSSSGVIGERMDAGIRNRKIFPSSKFVAPFVPMNLLITPHLAIGRKEKSQKAVRIFLSISDGIRLAPCQRREKVYSTSPCLRYPLTVPQPRPPASGDLSSKRGFMEVMEGSRNSLLGLGTLISLDHWAAKAPLRHTRLPFPPARLRGES